MPRLTKQDISPEISCPPGGTPGQVLQKKSFLDHDIGWGDQAAGGGTPGDTVVAETAFGQSSTAGVSSEFSRKDHTHGSPVDPVTAHEAAPDPHTQYTLSTELASHEGAADPHTGYQRESEKGIANGYASLDSGGTVPDAQIPSGVARDTEVTSAIAAHEGAGDPHTQYTLSTELAAHEAAADPHTVYQRESEKGVANGYASLDVNGLVPDAQIPSGIARDSEIPVVAQAGEVADSSTGAEADGISPRYARADHVHHYEAGTPGAHATSHQNGGADEISVAGLSGALADAQTPTAHASSHQPGGGDAMAVDAVAGTGSLRTLGTGAQQAAVGSHAHTNAILRVPLAIPVLAALVWTNMPAALSFWLSTATVAKDVQRIDLTGYTQVRLRVNKQGTAGGASAKLILRYKTTSFTQAVADYSDIGTSEVSVAINVQNSYLDTGWINLATNAKADVFLTLLGSGGDGVLDPAFGYVVAEFK